MSRRPDPVHLSAAVVVSSCDKYEDVWSPFFTLFFRYWPDCPFPVYLISDHRTYPDPRVTTLATGGDDGWASRVRRALLGVPTPFVLYLQEDYLLDRPVRTARVLEYLRYMQAQGAGCLRLYPWPSPDLPHADHPELGEISKTARYAVSVQAAFWDKKVLLGLLVDGESVWDLERKGSIRARELTVPFLGVRGETALASGISVPTHPERLPLSYLATGVVAGRWMPAALELCRREGVAVDLTRRPVEMPPRPKARQRLQQWLKRSEWGSLLLAAARPPYGFARRHLRRILDHLRVVRHMIEYSRLGPAPSFRIRLRDTLIYAGEWRGGAGSLDCYALQDLWAARKVYQLDPRDHWDVGSRVDGFITHLLTFRRVGVVDLRPLVSTDPNLEFLEGSITDLPFSDRSLESLSSLNVVEHIGLGRYGNPVDPEGWRKAVRELQRVPKPNGRLLFSVPIGRERVQFNAHRIFSPATIESAFDELVVREFSVINDAGRLVLHADPRDYCDARFSIGLWEFERPSGPRAAASKER